MWSFHFISYPRYRPSIHWMQSSPKCRFPWMSICPRFPLRQAPPSHLRSQRIFCLPHYNSLMFTQLLQGEKKSPSDICGLVNQHHRRVYILSYLVGLNMCMWDKWSVISLSSLLNSNIWFSNHWSVIILPRSYLLTNIPEEGDNKLTDAKLQGYAAVLSIGSTRCKANTLGMSKYYFSKNVDSFLLYTQCFYFGHNYRPQHYAELAISCTNHKWDLEQHPHQWISQHWLLGM